MLEVYLDPCTINCRKVLAAFELMGVEFKQHRINYFAGEHKTEKCLKVNPCATVPYATDGDLVVTESNAIMAYAADLKGDDLHYPSDLKKRADVNRWLFWEASVWFQSCYVFIVQNVVQPRLGNRPDQQAVDAETETWNKLAAVLDQRLSGSRFLCGNGPTIADIAVASSMHVAEHMKLPLEKHPNLKRWYFDNIVSLQCWKKTQDAVEKALIGGNKTSSPTGVPKANGKLTGGQVRANLNYTKDLSSEGRLTELYYYEADAAKGIHEPGDDPHEVTFTDGWPKRNDFGVDTHGFSIHDFKTTFDDWSSEQAVASLFYPEVEEFLKAKFRAKRVLVFDHTIRTPANANKKLTQESNTTQRAPISLVHCDYTDVSGPTRVRQLLPDEAEQLLSRRVAFFNFWKPLHRTVEEWPLAMCDMTSARFEDLFRLHLRYRDRDGENYVMKYSPAHKWWYFPKMTPEQAIVLKTYESELDGRARFVAHSAFNDPDSPPDAPQRESIELRTIAFF